MYVILSQHMPQYASFQLHNFKKYCTIPSHIVDRQYWFDDPESPGAHSSDESSNSSPKNMRPKRFPVLPDLVSSILSGVKKNRKPYLRLDVANFISNNFGGELLF